MAYGLQFSATWAGSLNGFEFKLEFYEKDTTDETSPPSFLSSVGGLVRETGRRGADPNEPICKSWIHVTLIDKRNVIFQRLAGSNDKGWRIDLRRSGTIIGQYWLVPDSLGRPSTRSGPQVITLRAADGLSYLSKIAYDNGGVPYTGRDKVRHVLRKSSDLTGLSRRMVTFVNWRPYLTNQLTASDDPLNHLRVNQGLYTDDDDNPLSAGTVIEQLSGRFLARFFQSDEGWVVAQRRQTVDDWALSFGYDTDGTPLPISPPQIDDTVRVEGTDLTIIDGGGEAKVPAWKNASAAYQHGRVRESFTKEQGIAGNGSFDEWDKGNALPNGWRVASGVVEGDIRQAGSIASTFGFSLVITGINYTATGSHPNDKADGYVEYDADPARPIFTVDQATDVITSNGHGLADGQQVQPISSGTLPPGMQEGRTYYVINSTTNTLKLSETFGGSSIDIAGNGTGTHKLKAIDSPYNVDGGAGRYIIWQGRARLMPNRSDPDTTISCPIRVQRFVVGDEKTWYAKEDETWSIDTPYTITLGDEEAAYDRVMSDNLTMELQDSAGDDITGQVRIRLYRQEDNKTTDTSEPLIGVEFDNFGVLYQESTTAEDEPHTTTTTVSVNNSENNVEGAVQTYLNGDGPTAAHIGRLTIIDTFDNEIQVTAGWKVGTYSGGASTGYSIDKLHSEERLQERRTAVKRRFEGFKLSNGVNFQFYCSWKRTVTSEITGLYVAGLPTTFVNVKKPVDVGRELTIGTDTGDVTRTAEKIEWDEANNYYVLTLDSSVTDPSGNVSYDELYTPTYLQEDLLQGRVRGEFVEYLAETSTADLTATTVKTRGTTDPSIEVGVVQAYSVQGAKTVDTVDTDLIQEAIGATAKAIVARKNTSSALDSNLVYIGDPNDTSTAADGGRVVASSDGKRWKLPEDTGVRSTWYAVGNGVADDRANLAAMDAATGHNIISRGTYLVNSAITLTDNVFETDAILKPASGIEITLAGSNELDLSQHFDRSLGGSITYATGAVAASIPQWFGAVGDDSTDCTSAIQAAIDALGDDGGIVLFPAGTYRITAPIVASSGVTFEGMALTHWLSSDNKGVTIKNTGTGNAFTFTAGGSQTNSMVQFRHLRIIGSATSAHGIQITGGQGCQIIDCHLFRHGGDCIHFDGNGIGNVVKNCRVQPDGIGGNCILIGGNCTTTWVHDNRIEDCGSGFAGVKVNGTDGMHAISHNLIESNDGKGVWVVGATTQIEISHNWFEGNDQVDSGDQDIYLQGTEGNTITACHIVGNRINSSGVSHALLMEYCSENLILGNRMANPTPVAIEMDANSNDNLLLWNIPNSNATYTDNGLRNIRQERTITYEIGSNAKLRGNVNLNSFLLRDTTVPNTPTFGFVNTSPEGAVGGALGSIRGMANQGAVFGKRAGGTGNTGWGRLAYVSPGIGTFADGTTTPSVSEASTPAQVFATANTTPTTITNFLNGKSGQIITLIIGDANTTVGGSILMRNDAPRLMGTNEVLQFAYNGTIWIEIPKSYINYGRTWFNLSSGSNPNVKPSTTRGIFKTNNGTPQTVTDFNNAEDGQIIYIVGNDGGNTTFSDTAGTISLRGRNTHALANGELIAFQLFGSLWIELTHPVPEFQNLNGIALSSLADGDAVIYNSTSGDFENQSNTFANLIDGSISAPGNDDFLVFDNATSKWANLDSASARAAMGAASVTGVNDHLADTTNPHSVTAAQAGAEPANPLSAVAQLGMTVADPPSQVQVQAIADKVDEIISALS